jgi:hypothetical protein
MRKEDAARMISCQLNRNQPTAWFAFLPDTHLLEEWTADEGDDERMAAARELLATLRPSQTGLLDPLSELL